MNSVIDIDSPDGERVQGHLKIFSVIRILLHAAQRSAQELPLVEKQSLDSYPATGGKRMLLSGHNFLPDSKVMFVEKAQGESDEPSHIPLPFLLTRSSILFFSVLHPSPLLSLSAPPVSPSK